MSTTTRISTLTRLALFVTGISFFTTSVRAQNTEPEFIPGSNLAFIPNAGQITNELAEVVNDVHFKASVPGLEFYLTETGISYVFVQHTQDKYDPALGGSPDPDFQTMTSYTRIDMVLKNANLDQKTVVKEHPTASAFNYYYAHCPDGRLGLQGYHQLTYRNVYSNIDWVIYSKPDHSLKYEFVVHPGGDPSQIRMEYKYADVYVCNGAITLSTPAGAITEQNLYVYLKESGMQVDAKYLQEGNEVSIQVDAPSDQTLIIDLPLEWASYWGSSGNEQPQALITSGNGEYVFIAGYTNSTNYPTTNPGGGAYFQGTFAGGYDAFVAQFDTSGFHFWSTYYGGTLNEGSTSYTGISISCGAGTDLWLVGTTNSTNLPLQNAGGGAYYQSALAGGYDFFIVKFNYSGVRQHATYFGGTSDDGGTSHGNGADCDASGNLYFAGKTISTNFPMLNPGGGAYFDNTQNGSDDLCIVKLSQGGQHLWSTYFGGTGDDMNYSMDLHLDRANSKLYVGTCSNSTNLPCVNPGGGAYFDNTNNGGTDVFFARFSLAGVQEWGTYVGGTGEEWLAMSMSSAPDGDIGFITLTNSTNMPCVNPGGGAFFDNTSNGSYDVYLARFETNGTMSWSTYYGSTNNEHCQHNLTFDGNGNIISCSVSDGTAAPPTFNPGPPHFYDGTKDAQGTYCLVQYDPGGVMLWGTFWGGSGHDHLFGTVGACIGVSAHSDIFVTGETTSADLPVLNPGGGVFFDNTNDGAKEGFIAKFQNDIPLVILPVEMLSHDCRETPAGVEVFWTTATEHHNDHFVIERTRDGKTYTEIGRVEGAGNSSQPLSYVFVDEDPYYGVNYYRITQIDLDGKSESFSISACQHVGNAVTVNVYTLTGQLLLSLESDDYRAALNQSHLPNGVYVVELRGEETRTVRHVLAR